MLAHANKALVNPKKSPRKRSKRMDKLPIKAVLSAIFCGVLFGSAFPAIKLGYAYFSITNDVFSKILYAGIRFFISGIFVYIITFCRQKKAPTLQKNNIVNVILLALTYTFLQYTFFYLGLSNTTGSIGSIVSSSSVFIAIVLAHFVYPDDKLNAKKILGCIVGFGGVLIACLGDSGFTAFSFTGEGFILLASAFYVVGSVFSKKAANIDGSFTATAFNLLIGGTLLIIIGLIGKNGEMQITWQGVLVLAYLVLVSSLGFTLWSSLLSKYPIGKLSVYNFIIPVSGTFLSAIVLGENLFQWQYLVALLLVSVGIVIVNLTIKNKSKK